MNPGRFIINLAKTTQLHRFIAEKRPRNMKIQRFHVSFILLMDLKSDKPFIAHNLTGSEKGFTQSIKLNIQ